MTTFRAAPAAWLALALAAAAGCGGGGKPAGSVAGTVTYNGAPLTTGVLNLMSAAGSAALAKIGDGGTFKIDGELPAGEYKAYLSPPVPEPQPPGTKAAAPKKFDVLPKFQDPATSGTTVTVKAGANDVKVEFK